MILLGEFGGLLELQVLSLVLFEDSQKLFFFIDLNLGLLLVRLDLLFELFGLGVDLSSEGVFDAALLAILLTQLSGHELHLLGALFLELLILNLQVSRLLLD